MLICPVHGRVAAPGGNPKERGEWRRVGSTWVHICGREEVGVMPSQANRDNTGDRPVTREPRP